MVHCHADHFEPEIIAKQLGAAADLALWFERCKPAVPTLFVKTPVGPRLDKSADTGASLRLNSCAAIEAGYLRTLVELGAGVGLHVHHEAWTRNELSPGKLSSEQLDLHSYAMRRADPKQDHARMSAVVEGSLAWLRSATGLALQTWHFVHGCWAFGASDPEICQLEGEVKLLYKLGCRADFSFPAGRRRCDPTWDRPKWIRPTSGVRAVEQSDADPRDDYAADRMLVWASRTDGWWCGLDTYSQDSRRLTESPDKIERYFAICPVINGTAYIKTCSHGMHPYYWQDGPRPTLGAFAAEFAGKCASADVSLEFRTTEQVVCEIQNQTPVVQTGDD